MKNLGISLLIATVLEQVKYLQKSLLKLVTIEKSTKKSLLIAAFLEQVKDL